METEMTFQSNEKAISKSTTSYSKIGTKEDCYIDPKDIKLGIYSKELNQEDNNYFVNSDQLLPISIEKSHKYFYKKLGNTYAFLGDIYGDPKIIIGPHWPLYIIVTSFFSIGVWLIYSRFGIYFNIYLKIIGIIIYLIFLISYTYTATINPGYPKHDIDSITGEPRKKFYYCNICKLWASREKKTMHCSDCNICVEGNDHHCPWTGKCIGVNNFKSFIIFVVSIFVLFAYFIFLVSNIDKNHLIKSVDK
jgi:hypothetical protein